MTTLSEELEPALTALADRIIPEDDYPSASQAGVIPFVLSLLQKDLITMLSAAAHGLEMLNRESIAIGGTAFEGLSSSNQDKLIAELLTLNARDDWNVSPASFMRLMICLVSEGYYADPENGGNLNAVSWQMIGFDVREGMRLFPEAAHS